MFIKLVFTAITTLTMVLGLPAYHFNGYLYENDWSHLCEKREIPSIFLPRNVAEASSQVVHFAQIDLPYSCSISVRTEPGTVILLVIQVSSADDVSNACKDHDSQVLVYRAGETFGGYWGNMWKEDIAYTTDHHNYYGITHPEEKTTTESEIKTWPERQETTTATVPTTPKMNAMEVILPIVNISMNLNETDEEFTEKYKIPYHENFINELKLRPAGLYDTVTLPIATFALNYPQLGYRELEITSTTATPTSSKRPSPDYDHETTPVDIDNYTIDIFKPRAKGSVTGRKYHLSVTSRRPYYQKKIVTSSLENLIFQNTKDCGPACKSTTLKSEQQQDEDMKTYLRGYLSTLYTYVDKYDQTQVVIEEVKDSQYETRGDDEATNSIEQINQNLKKISKMFVSGTYTYPEQSYKYIKGNESNPNINFQDGDDDTDNSGDYESPEYKDISPATPLSWLINKQQHYTGGNDSSISTTRVLVAKTYTRPSIKMRKEKRKRTKPRMVVDSRHKYYKGGNESVHRGLITLVTINPNFTGIGGLTKTSQHHEEHKKVYTSGWDSGNIKDRGSSETTETKLPSMLVKQFLGDITTTFSYSKTSTQAKHIDTTTHVSTKAITVWTTSGRKRLHTTKIAKKEDMNFTEAERPYLHFVSLAPTSTTEVFLNENEAWMKGLDQSADRRMVNHKSWENVVKAVPDIAVALNANKNLRNIQNNTILFRSHQKSQNNRTKRFISLIALHRRKSIKPATEDEIKDTTVAYATKIVDTYRFAEFIELENPINRMSIVMTSALVLREPQGKCPQRMLECQVSGQRICIDSVHACDGIPNCAANDIYDEDRVTCGKLSESTEYDVYVAAFTLLALLLTLLYAVHYWLNRCVPKVSEAFFVYRDGIENKLCLSSIMKPPGDSEDDILHNTSFEVYVEDEVIYDNKDHSQHFKFRDNPCFKFIRKLFRREEKISKEVSVDFFVEENNDMYAFAMSEIEKIAKETKEIETQTGASLEMNIVETSVGVSTTTTVSDTVAPTPDKHSLRSRDSSLIHIGLEQWSPSITSDLSLLRFMKKISEQKHQQQQSRKSFAVSIKSEREVSNFIFTSDKVSSNEPSTSSASVSTSILKDPAVKVPMKQIRFEEKPSIDQSPGPKEGKRKTITAAVRKSHDEDYIDEDDETSPFRRFWTGMKMLPKKKSAPRK